MVVTVPGEKPPGLVIKRDGTPVAAAEWGIALPVDPGPHGFSAAAPGRRTWHRTIEAAAGGGTITVAVPDLAPEEGAQPVDPRDAAFDPPAATDRDAGADASKPLSTRRTVAAVLVGAGAVGVAVGTTFGFVSWAKHAESNSGCDRANVCTATAGAARNDAIGAGNVSTVSFAIGLGVAAAGAVVWLTEPGAGSGTSAAPSRPRVGVAPAPGGAALVGTFE